MIDVWGREVGQLELVLVYPGKGYMKEAEYGIVVGTSAVFTKANNVMKLSKCYHIVNRSLEQDNIREDLLKRYQLHTTKVVQAGGYKKIEPEVFGWYQGDSEVISYIYIGEFKIDVNEECRKKNFPEKYLIGGHCYIKIQRNSTFYNYLIAKLRKQEDEGSVFRFEEFKMKLYEYLNMMSGLETNRWYQNISNELSNFVVSTRKRTFMKRFGKFKFDRGFYDTEIFDSNYMTPYMKTTYGSRQNSVYTALTGSYIFTKV